MPSATWVWSFWSLRWWHRPCRSPSRVRQHGDLVAALLALVAIVALRARWPGAIPLAWIANVVGTLDLLYAVYQGISHDVGPHLGAAWYIPTFAVPALYVTHFMIFEMLVKRGR